MAQAMQWARGLIDTWFRDYVRLDGTIHYRGEHTLSHTHTHPPSHTLYTYTNTHWKSPESSNTFYTHTHTHTHTQYYTTRDLCTEGEELAQSARMLTILALYHSYSGDDALLMKYFPKVSWV